jgi:ATP-binding cassette subfamily B protein
VEVRHLARTLALLRASAGRWTALWLLLLLVQGLLPAATVYLTRGVVDGLTPLLGGNAGWAAAGPFVTPAVLLGAVLLGIALASGAAGWVQTLQSELLQDHIRHLIHQKSVTVGMSFYDFPDFFDHLHRARDEAAYRPAVLLGGLGGLLQNGVTLVAVAAVLLPYGVWLPAVLVLATAPSLVVVLRSALRRRAWKLAATPVERRIWYYDWLLTAREAAAEVRLFDLGRHYSQAFQTLRRRLRSENLALLKREALGEILAVLLGLCVGGGAVVWVVSEAMAGRITAGGLAMFYAAFAQGQGLMRSLLHNAGNMYTNSLFLGNLFAFLELKPEAAATGDPEAPQLARLRQGIRFDSVDFSYPGSARPALTGFSLDIQAGQTVAIVGPNGAGKSTVIKLLCRFYEPDCGRVLADGRDIREWAPAEWRRSISALFQDPVRYAATVLESVSPAELDDSLTAGRVRDALDAAGAEEIVRQLPRQHHTMLGKTFDDGVELSGGEWQRIALARALVRDVPILLLDEPTGAMDSWAEAEWFDRFRGATLGRTTIIITHRFTTAMRADVIHVMAHGRIVESGSHDQLVAQGGRYAESWSAQIRESAIGATL